MVLLSLYFHYYCYHYFIIIFITIIVVMNIIFIVIIISSINSSLHWCRILSTGANNEINLLQTSFSKKINNDCYNKNKNINIKINFFKLLI